MPSACLVLITLPSLIFKTNKKQGYGFQTLRGYYLNLNNNNKTKTNVPIIYKLFNDNYGGKALLTNTVHDCVWVDSKKEVARQVAEELGEVLSRVPEVLNEYYPEMAVTAKFPTDTVVGATMGKMFGIERFDFENAQELPQKPKEGEKKKEKVEENSNGGGDQKQEEEQKQKEATAVQVSK